MRLASYLIKTILSLIILVMVQGVHTTNAQSNFCPPNLDFEQGNLSNWHFYTGNCCPINANTSTVALANRHVLTSGSGIDYYGKFPVVAPGGGSYSLKLGNVNVGSQAERARYYIRVPNNQSDYIFIYKYAVVFQDPGHITSAQPRFEVNAYDSATQAPVPCNQFTYISSSNLPGFFQSPVNTGVYYKPWTTATIDLTGYAGKTIALDFSSGDCGFGAHFGYGYVDMNCGLFQIKGVSCNGDTTLTLNAPPGFQHYKWMDTTLTQTIGNTQTVVIPKFNAHSKYAIIVTPYTGFGCPDTFFTTYVEDTVSVTALVSSDTTICNKRFASLAASGVGANQPFSFNWYPNTGLSCSTCVSPFAAPQDTTTYNVIVKDLYGCKDTASVTVNVLPGAYAGKDTTACPGDSITLHGSGDAVSHLWFPSNNMSGAGTLTPRVKVVGNFTYYLAMTTAAGCVDTDAVTITANPPAIANAGANQSACAGDSVTLSGTISQNSSFVWTPAAGLSSDTILNPRAIANTGTPYYLAVTNNYGCHATDSVYVYTYTDPAASVGNDTSVCINTYFRISVQSAASISSYRWSPQNKVSNHTIQNPFVFADSERIYKVVITSTDGCVDSDEVKVSIYPKPVAGAGPDVGACMGQPASLQGSGAGTGGFYFWYPSTNLSNPAIPNPVATVTANRTYALVVSTIYSCKDTDNVNVILHPDPVADAGPDTSVCTFAEIQLRGKSGTLYRWQPLAGLNNPYIDTPKAFVTAPVSYQLKVYNQFGCSSIDSIHITLSPSPLADAGPDTALCTGKWFKLRGSGGAYFNWSPTALVSSPYIPDPLVHADSARSYTLIVTNIQGCSDTDEVQIDVNLLPVADAGPDTVLCIGDLLALQGSGGGQYLWSPAAGLSSATIADPELTVNGNATYILQVTNQYNCIGTDTVSISTHPQPKVDAGIDTIVCPGAEIMLNGKGGGTYAWYPPHGLSDTSVRDPLAVIDSVIRYKLVVTNLFGCTDSAFIVIDTIPLKFSVEQPGYICSGTEVNLNASGGDSYNWWPADLLDNNSNADPIATPIVNTVFGVEIREAKCGRVDTLYVNTDVRPLPDLKIDVIDIDCAREFGELSASGALEYSWTPVDGLDDPGGAYTIARPEVTTRYILTGTDALGCKDTASVVMDVLKGDGRLYLPDAFTPNGDGVNDCYRLHIPGDVTEFEFSIYNRYGERVFYTTDRNHCWDGTYKGVPAELSTYFYYYKATSSVCGRIFRKGDMHLIR